MGIGVSGLMSGLDTDSIVSQLMDIEKRPVMLLQQKEAAYQAKITALGVVKSSMSDLKSSVDALKNPDDFISYSASSSDTDILTVSANDDIQEGNYNIIVNSLASEQHVRSAAFTASDAEVGTGTLTIQLGNNEAVDVVIDSDHNTLEGIAQAINEADANVTAGVIYDGTNYYLTMQGLETGADNTITMTMQDDDGVNNDNAGLSSLYTDPTTQSLTETQAAANAVLTLNGIENIQRPTNTIDDLIDGISITLKDADATKTVSITSSKNYSGLTSKLNNFIKNYNALIDTLAEQTAYNGDQAQNGTLLGDSTVGRIAQSLSSMIYEEVDGVDSSVNSLSNLGIEIEDNGHLSLNEDKLNTAMEEHPDDVITFFTADDTDNEGIAVRMYNFLDDYLESDTGILSAKEKGLQDSIDNMNDHIDQMNIRFAKREDNLRKQFNHLELLLAQYQDTAARLDQQLTSISNINAYIAKDK